MPPHLDGTRPEPCDNAPDVAQHLRTSLEAFRTSLDAFRTRSNTLARALSAAEARAHESASIFRPCRRVSAPPARLPKTAERRGIRGRYIHRHSIRFAYKIKKRIDLTALGATGFNSRTP